MKKMIFALVMSFTTLNAICQSLLAASKWPKIAIKYERGKKEWNADRTQAQCIGRGMCTLSVGMSKQTGISLENQDGKIFIIFDNKSFEESKDDFIKTFDINNDQEITLEHAKKLKLDKAFSIQKGSYFFRKVKDGGCTIEPKIKIKK